MKQKTTFTGVWLDAIYITSNFSLLIHQPYSHGWLNTIKLSKHFLQINVCIGCFFFHTLHKWFFLKYVQCPQLLYGMFKLDYIYFSLLLSKDKVIDLLFPAKELLLSQPVKQWNANSAFRKVPLSQSVLLMLWLMHWATQWFWPWGSWIGNPAP